MQASGTSTVTAWCQHVAGHGPRNSTLTWDNIGCDAQLRQLSNPDGICWGGFFHAAFLTGLRASQAAGASSLAQVGNAVCKCHEPGTIWPLNSLHSDFSKTRNPNPSEARACSGTHRPQTVVGKGLQTQGCWLPVKLDTLTLRLDSGGRRLGCRHALGENDGVVDSAFMWS